MDLVSFSLKGYGRFADRTSIKLAGRMTAVVGPNEAGKSTLLRALSRMGDNEGFSSSERTRRSKVEPELRWTFRINEHDRVALTHIPEAVALRRAQLTKRSDGSRFWTLFPHPVRSTDARTLAHKMLIDVEPLVASATTSIDGFEADLLASVASTLESATETLSDEEIDTITSAADYLESRKEEVAEILTGEDDLFDDLIVALRAAKAESARADSPAARASTPTRPAAGLAQPAPRHGARQPRQRFVPTQPPEPVPMPADDTQLSTTSAADREPSPLWGHRTSRRLRQPNDDVQRL